MGRPATIHIDRLAVLRNIANAIVTKRAALEAEREALAARMAAGEQRRPMYSRDCPETWLKDLQINGIAYDLPAFLGRWPTSSERIRTQQAIRQLAADGLVELIGDKARRVLVTPAGWQAAALVPAERRHAS